MKLEVGMYVRTKYGFHKISRIVLEGTSNEYYNCDLKENENGGHIWISVLKEEILKASHNIIDLIEVGDYVNGKLVTKINQIFPINQNKYIECHCEMNGVSLTWCYSNKEIKSIVTKEQFSQMQYKVGE